MTGSIRYAYLHDMVDSSVDKVISRLNTEVNTSRIKKKNHSTQQKNEVISDENIQKLLMRFPEGNSSHIPIMLGYHLGLRSGEAYGVRWNNIDFENNTVCIDGQVIYDDEQKEWFYREPKKNSKRTINMDNKLRELLLREKARQEENKKSNKYVEVKIDENKMINYFEGENANFVVHHKYGGFISSNAKMHIANTAHKELNIPFTFHSLRHTHCTYLADNGVDLYYLYQRMGHKSIKTTMKYYVDSTDTLLKNNFEQLNSLFSESKKGSE